MRRVCAIKKSLCNCGRRQNIATNNCANRAYNIYKDTCSYRIILLNQNAILLRSLLMTTLPFLDTDLAGFGRDLPEQKCYHFLFKRYRLEHYTVSSNWLALGTLMLFTTLSLSRSVALFRGYHAPLDLFPELQHISRDPSLHTVPEGRPVTVCVGKEWHRFPSSFLLPNDWRLQFIKSEFRGQLPQPYADGPLATQTVPAHMNDQNLEEPTRYVDIRQCHYLVDLDLETTAPREPRYTDNPDDWTVIANKPFLNAARSSPLFRAFFIPFLSGQHTSYAQYVILKPARPNLPRKRPHA